jgi:outer membrane protein OmpA-like peptidoglycan-associated protein
MLASGYAHRPRESVGQSANTGRFVLAVVLLCLGTGSVAVIDWILLPRYLAARERGGAIGAMAQAPAVGKIAVAPAPTPVALAEAPAVAPTPTPPSAVAPTPAPPSKPTTAPSPPPVVAAQPVPAAAATPAPAPPVAEGDEAKPAPAAALAVAEPESDEAAAKPVERPEPDPAPVPPESSPPSPVLPNLLFANNTAWLSRASRATLAEVVRALEAQPDLRVLLKGHTDDVGEPELNFALARERARRASQWLRAHGVDARRIELHSYGSRHPLNEDPSAEGRARNRRVEIELK